MFSSGEARTQSPLCPSVRSSAGGPGPVLFQRPSSRSAGHSWPLFFAPKALPPRSEFRASKPVTRASPALGMVDLEPCQGAFSGTKNHPAPNDPKLGRLRCTRQGLVRVPESNTKYGANWGKPGDVDPSDLTQVSVSPQGFPSEKNLISAARSGFTPLFTGQLYFVPSGPLGGCSGKTHVRLRKLGQACRPAHGLGRS